MASSGPKFPLSTRFDDLCRNSKLLTDNFDNTEFVTFVINQEECRKQWLETTLELDRLIIMYNKEKTERIGLQSKIDYCRKMLAQEMQRRKKAEKERESLNQVVCLVKDILCDSNTVNDQTREKLAFLNSPGVDRRLSTSPKHLDTIDESAGSILSPSELNSTGDELDEVTIRARNRLKLIDLELAMKEVEENSPRKEPKNAVSNITRILTADPTDIQASPFDRVKALAASEVVPMTRSFSEPSAPTQSPATPLRQPLKSDGELDEQTSLWIDSEIKLASSMEPTQQYKPRYSLDRVSTRPHDFVSKTIVKPEKCISCDKRIKFGKLALRCKDCRIICHVDCKQETPIPCTPISDITKTKGLVGCVISDFGPRQPPFIPPLILHCIMEIENRGLTEPGLYRKSGSDKEVRDLKEKFLNGKGIPKLTKFDIHAVCGCLKDFLRTLKEPLITYALWQDFVEAAEIPAEKSSVKKLTSLIEKLPLTNRDSLIYLLLHLMKISQTPECKMSPSNLSRVLGPTIIGYSSTDPKQNQISTETKLQGIVIERLLKLNQDYLASFIFPSMDVSLNETATPEIPVKSPFSPPSSSKKKIGHTPLGPRKDEGKTKFFKRHQNFFASPMLQ